MYPGCYPGLYSFWGFAPSLLVISAVKLCFGVIILWKLRPVLAYNINCYITTRTYHHTESCGNFAPSLLVTTVAAHCPYSDIVPLLLVTMPATAIHNIFFCLWDVLFAATGFTKNFIRSSKKYCCLAKFVLHSLNACVHGFPTMKIRFFCFIRC